MSANGKLAIDLYSDADGHLALPIEGFRRVVKPAGLRLDPIEGFPVVWRYTEPDGKHGTVLNVPGLLNGGAMSITSRGWLYEAEREGHAIALFLPGAPKRMALGDVRYKTLPADPPNKPQYPVAWPKAAVRHVVRARFRTIVVLDAAWLLEQIPRLPPIVRAAVPAAVAEPSPAEPPPSVTP